MRYNPSNSRENSIARLLVAGSLLLACGLLQAAEVRYVSDQLSLKMYKDSALNKTLPSLKSGDKVEILKQDDGYARVKTEDGTKGWVKSSYLVEEKPAALKLIDVQEELDNLRSKHTDLLLEQPAVPESDNAELLSRVEQAEAERQSLQNRLGELQTQNTRQVEELRELRQKSESKPSEKTLILWIIIPLLTLITGFFIGFKYLEAKVKARFGGYNPV